MFNTRWFRLLGAAVLLGSLTTSAVAATNLYKIRLEGDTQPNGVELVQATKQLCVNFSTLQRHRLAMIQQKDGNTGAATDFATVATNWAILDSTNAESDDVAQALFTELDSFIGNGGPSLEQWCGRILQ